MAPLINEDTAMKFLKRAVKWLYDNFWFVEGTWNLIRSHLIYKKENLLSKADYYSKAALKISANMKLEG
ncbi:unnamed protein product [Oikopleura dioica]|uniref:Uncharacterized protein n=1 Tax=Oikopleura dioica TaxID=34765 RepID=E4YYW7_OIKDI|nr:unnamed protein product [Oikopleura dioica]